ncbi:glycolipid transfer protein [Tetranychus urticae]|uniref:Glycolipid transfer protein domain-containing protein n=1 Tax=Tetranychus urticae TaxID=32264 RepID=T1KUY3_TETUR|nr:glycolipid transfer protein [Tetranychus urticae]XP_015790669.1 glycolipid transfer protein [Tetranychus urticae]
MEQTSREIDVNNESKENQESDELPATNNELFKFLKFPAIKPDSPIPIQPFLDACRSLIDFVTILGPVFIPVRSDIGGNVDKLTKILNTDPSRFTTLNSIIESEIGLSSVKQIGTDALLWLTRALQYMNMFLSLLVDDYSSDHNGELSNDLTKHFTLAYDSTLRKHHNWIVQNVVHLSLKAAPSRNTIINLLSPEINSSAGIDKEKEKCLYQEMNDYRELVEININSIHQLYDRLSIEY